VLVRTLYDAAVRRRHKPHVPDDLRARFAIRGVALRVATHTLAPRKGADWPFSLATPPQSHQCKRRRH